LALAGFTKYFASKRVQVIGNAEAAFLQSLTEQERERRCLNCSRTGSVRGLLPRPGPDPRSSGRRNRPACGVQLPAHHHEVHQPGTLALEAMFAPAAVKWAAWWTFSASASSSRESGIGKSECVLALIDGATACLRRRHQSRPPRPGKSSAAARNHPQPHGSPRHRIINVAAMFGVSPSARKSAWIDRDVESLERSRGRGRLGVEDEYVKILGIKIPHITIPVRPDGPGPADRGGGIPDQAEN